MFTDKISNNLKNRLLHTKNESCIEVVISLQPIAKSTKSALLSRRQQIATLQQAFNEELEPVERAINSQGGHIIHSAWINQTVNASISTKSIDELAQLKEVAEIDLPAPITRED